MLPIWAQCVDQYPRKENSGSPETACPPGSCSPGSGGVRMGPDRFQEPPSLGGRYVANTADVSCTPLPVLVPGWAETLGLSRPH